MNEDMGIHSPEEADPVTPVLKRPFKWARISAAASVALLLLAGLFFYIGKSDHKEPANLTETNSENEIRPGSNKRSEERRVGKSVTVRVDIGGRLILKKTKQK